jgi:hypothetical protein
MNIDVILVDSILFLFIYSDFTRVCFEFVWKYAHCRTVTHCCTTGQPHTTTHTLPDRTLPRAHCRTARHSHALCRTMPHTAWIRMLHTAHRTPHAAHRIQSHTGVNMNYNIVIECICIYMDLLEFMWIYMNSYEWKQFYLNVNELTWILTWFYLILFHIFDLCRIYTNVCKFIRTYVELSEKIYTARL